MFAQPANALTHLFTALEHLGEGPVHRANSPDGRESEGHKG